MKYARGLVEKEEAEEEEEEEVWKEVTMTLTFCIFSFLSSLFLASLISHQSSRDLDIDLIRDIRSLTRKHCQSHIHLHLINMIMIKIMIRKSDISHRGVHHTCPVFHPVTTLHPYSLSSRPLMWPGRPEHERFVTSHQTRGRIGRLVSMRC